jgi:hypothetical protein
MKLRELLKRADISAERLSEKIGIPVRTLSYHWTTGRIPYPLIYKIQKVTGLSIEDIVPEYLAMYWEALFDKQTRTNLPRGGKSKQKDKEDTNMDRPEFWFALAKWAKDHDRLSPFDRHFAFNIGVLLSREKTPSPKQTKLAARIRSQSIDEGYNESLLTTKDPVYEESI